MTDVIERARRMAEQARQRDNPALDWWHVVEAEREFDLFLVPPQTFDWVAAKYPGAAITRC